MTGELRINCWRDCGQAKRFACPHVCRERWRLSDAQRASRFSAQSRRQSIGFNRVASGHRSGYKPVFAELIKSGMGQSDAAPRRSWKKRRLTKP